MFNAKGQSPMRLGVCFALGAALISGLNNFLTKIAVTEVKDAIVYTTMKNGVAAFILLALLAAAGGFRGLAGHFRRHPWVLMAVGVFGGAVPFALYFTGLTGTTAINAALLHKTMVLWVAALAIPLLKERFRWPLYGGVAALFAGNLLIGGFGGFKFNVSELMILAATLFWSVENIVAKKVLADLPSLTLAVVRMGVGSLVLLPLALARPGFSAVAGMSLAGWGWTLLTGVLLSGYVFGWYAGLSRLPATVTVALLVPATLVTNVLSAIFVTHKWTGQQTVALLVTTAGLTVVGLVVKLLREPKTGPLTN